MIDTTVVDELLLNLNYELLKQPNGVAQVIKNGELAEIVADGGIHLIPPELVDNYEFLHDMLTGNPAMILDFDDEKIFAILTTDSPNLIECYGELFHEDREVVNSLKQKSYWEKLLDNKVLIGYYAMASFDYYTEVKDLLHTKMWNDAKFYIENYSFDEEFNSYIPLHILLSDEFFEFIKKNFGRYVIPELPEYAFDSIEFIIKLAELINNLLWASLDDALYFSAYHILFSRIPDNIYKEVEKYISDDLFFTRQILKHKFHVYNVKTQITKLISLEKRIFEFNTYVKEFKYAHNKRHIYQHNCVNLLELLSKAQKSETDYKRSLCIMIKAYNIHFVF